MIGDAQSLIPIPLPGHGDIPARLPHEPRKRLLDTAGIIALRPDEE
jgi:hypothetical protein